MNTWEPQRESAAPVALGPVIIVGLFMVFIWAGLHVMQNIDARDYPPAACQLFGGHWGIWSGWSCG